jgi:hypothetical protein
MAHASACPDPVKRSRIAWYAARTIGSTSFVSNGLSTTLYTPMLGFSFAAHNGQIDVLCSSAVAP